VDYGTSVGSDVHSDQITVARAIAGGNNPEILGRIPNTPQAVAKLVRKRLGDLDMLHVCYEAGPCGYGVYRQLREMGTKCSVVAPSLIPKAPGDRVKTDRRDASKLAGLLRSGDLTEVYVPTEADEALRNLARARYAAKED
jgi:transposase